MADRKLPDLTLMTAPASGDLFLAWDVSDTTEGVAGTAKNYTYGALSTAMVLAATTNLGGVNGLLKGNGSGTVSLATSGTDYQAALPSGSTSQYLRGDQTLATFATSVLAALPSVSGQSGKYLTNNGTVYSWGTAPVGTVTSVAMTVPSGLTITGSPITGSGTLALSTTLNGVLKGNGSGFVVATSGTDYEPPITAGSTSQYLRGDKSLATFSTAVASAMPTTGLTIQSWISPINTATDGATITLDWSTYSTQKVTLGGNRAVAFSNPVTGGKFTLIIIQDGTGSRTITSWPSSVTWLNGSNTAPTLPTAAGATAAVTFICTGTGAYLGFYLGASA